MRGRWHAAALVLLAACRLSDLTFYQPGGSDAAGGAGDDAGMTATPDADAGPPPPQFPSCIGLQATCGTAADSCCTSLAVPGGTFFRDHDLANNPPLSGDTSRSATISSFRLDRYDVTVARFRAFVAAGKGTQVHPPNAGDGAHPQLAGSGWDPSWNMSLEATTTDLIANIKCSIDQTWTDVPGSAAEENRPINCITWSEAMAFCIWDGGYLPTEAEWNYTAMGGDQQRAYPWSSSTSPLTIDASFASYNCSEDGMADCSLSDIVPVGTLPKGEGRWHHTDLAGNVDKWMLDWYEPYPTTCMDCANTVLTAGNPAFRSVRGGSFGAGADHLRGGFRDNDTPTRRNYINGIRCARPM